MRRFPSAFRRLRRGGWADYCLKPRLTRPGWQPICERYLNGQDRTIDMARPKIGEFVNQVKTEAGKIVWPKSRETMQTTIMVLIMTTLLELFFLGIDTFRSEEHTSELQSLIRISYAVFCLTQTT